MRADARERSRKAFDRQAGDYDTTAWGAHARRLYPHVMAALGGFTFSSLLDVGCGTGALLRCILHEHPLTSARGIDLSPEMVARARTSLGTRAHVLLGDSEHLPFVDGSFDVVICVDSFHHYPDPAQALAEMRRVSRPGGGLILADFWLSPVLRQTMNGLLTILPYGDVRVYSERELIALAERVGYRELDWSAVDGRSQVLVAVA